MTLNDTLLLSLRAVTSYRVRFPANHPGNGPGGRRSGNADRIR